MARAPQIHVVKRGDDWAVKQNGQVQGTHPTQANAAAAARMLGKIVHGEVSIHGKDGAVREKNSYGKDNFPPRG